MKIIRFASVERDSIMLITLVAISKSEAGTIVRNKHLPEAGVYAIEEDGITTIAESVEGFFPEVDMGNTQQRSRAFDEYADLLAECGEFIEIPKKLC